MQTDKDGRQKYQLDKIWKLKETKMTMYVLDRMYFDICMARQRMKNMEYENSKNSTATINW